MALNETDARIGDVRRYFRKNIIEHGYHNDKMLIINYIVLCYCEQLVISLSRVYVVRMHYNVTRGPVCQRVNRTVIGEYMILCRQDSFERKRKFDRKNKGENLTKSKKHTRNQK